MPGRLITVAFLVVSPKVIGAVTELGNQADVFHFWSLHPGGGHFLFADGSTHFVSSRVSPTLLPALATRNGGEVETVE